MNYDESFSTTSEAASKFSQIFPKYDISPQICQPEILCPICGRKFQHLVTHTLVCLMCFAFDRQVADLIANEIVLPCCPKCKRFLGQTWRQIDEKSPEFLELLLSKLPKVAQISNLHPDLTRAGPSSNKFTLALTFPQIFRIGATNSPFLPQPPHITTRIQVRIKPKNCPDCECVLGSSDVRSVVRIRHDNPSQKLLLHLEQNILRNSMERQVFRMEKSAHEFSFFFVKQKFAEDFIEFVGRCFAFKRKDSVETVDLSVRRQKSVRRTTVVLEFLQPCSNDLVILPQELTDMLGMPHRLNLCHKIGTSIRLLCPKTFHACDLNATLYTKFEQKIKILSYFENRTHFKVIDVHPAEGLAICHKSVGSNAIARVWLVNLERESDSKIIQCLSHIGHVLKPGDHVYGFDLTKGHLYAQVAPLYPGQEPPACVPIRKTYPESPRIWTLKRLKFCPGELSDFGIFQDSSLIELENSCFEDFCLELENNRYIRSKINLYGNRESETKPASSNSSLLDLTNSLSLEPDLIKGPSAHDFALKFPERIQMTELLRDEQLSNLEEKEDPDFAEILKRFRELGLAGQF